MTDDNEGTKDGAGGNKMEEIDIETLEALTNIGSDRWIVAKNLRETQSENIPILKSVPSRKKYHEIRLRVTPERYQMLKDICLGLGLDPGRIDDHSGVLVWDMLEWVTPLAKMRSKLIELYGPILRETPEREEKRR